MQIESALSDISKELSATPALLPKHYGGFVKKNDGFYKVIRDAGLATGKLTPKVKAG